MRKKLSHVKKRLIEYARSLAPRGGRPKNDREVTDIGNGSRRRTVVLRERVWRIELSRRNIGRFLTDHKIAVLAATGVLAAAIFGRLVLLGFASTADFYPSSCLGSWNNVQNALGKPDVESGSSISSFTALNSAVFGTSSAQMFCGNFSGDTDIVALEGKSFEKADLVLSWAFAFPESDAAPVASGGGGGSANVEANPVVSSTDGSAVLGADTSTVASTTNSAPDVLNNDNIVVPPTPDSSATSSIAPPPPADISPSPDPIAIPLADPTPPPVPPPAPQPDATDPAASPTSLLKMFLDVAYADETSSAATAFDATTSLADASVTPSVASSVEGIPTQPQPTAITLNTSMFQNIVLPASKPGDIVGIVYSTDGVTWQPLIDINKDNWQIARYSIPITSWDQLKHLQVAFIGLGDPNSPRILLDSAGVEVSYNDPPQGTVNITPDMQQPSDETNPPQPPSPADQAPQGDILQKTTIAQDDIFQQGAKQQCVAIPFSQTTAAGTSISFSIGLFSGLTTPSSTPDAKAATSSLPNGFQHAVYDVRLGSLPAGVTAVLRPGASSDTSSTEVMRFAVGSDAIRGSFSVLVIYRERQDDASLRSTGCQLNLVIQ